MEFLELLIELGRDYVIPRNFLTNSLKITGMLTLVIGVQLINTQVCLTPVNPPTHQAIEAVNYAPPDSGGPEISVGSGTR